MKIKVHSNTLIQVTLEDLHECWKFNWIHQKMKTIMRFRSESGKLNWVIQGMPADIQALRDSLSEFNQ